MSQSGAPGHCTALCYLKVDTLLDKYLQSPSACSPLVQRIASRVTTTPTPYSKQPKPRTPTAQPRPPKAAVEPPGPEAFLCAEASSSAVRSVADAYASLDVQAEGWCTGFVRSRFGDAAALGHAYQHMRQQTGEHDPQKVPCAIQLVQQPSPPKDVLERLTARGGAPGPAHSKVTTVGKNEITSKRGC